MTSSSGIENEHMSDQHPLDVATGQLPEELHKPIIRKFLDIIWGADLADMQLINKLNKGFRFLLYVITDIFSKCA